MLRVNLLCYLGFHQFNKEFCKRCGIERELISRPVFDQPKGETKFIESVSDKEKFHNAKNISDLLDN